MTARCLRSLVLPLAFAAAIALQGCSMARQATGSGSGGGGRATLEIVNNSSESIYSVNTSACSNTNWGPDRLVTISPGETMRVDLMPGCWDFRADFDSDHSSGNEVVQRTIRIDGGRSWTWNIE